MKLLYTTNSPYARKVRVVALEKHVDVALEMVNLSDPDCIVKNYNPLGKIPVLILDDQDSIYDSSVIVEFLDLRSPVAHLIPHDNTSKIAVRRWEALADGMTDAAVATMLESRKPAGQQSQAIIDRQMEKIKRSLGVMELEITKKKWCVNETFSLADIAIGCALGYLDLRFSHINWPETCPNLAKHYNILIKRPSFKQTMPVA
jgi:glutathione S-transferase